jgi:microcystin-dependent protein
MWAELNSILSSFNITPDASANNQILTALRLSSTFLSASSTVITGPLLVPGATIRVLFTADITGSNTSTGFSITYNGVNIPVKVYKDGSPQNFTAAKISWQDSTAVYKYLDAGTTLELLYDSVQFIIVNNPVVLKSIRHTIYADGTVGGGNIADVKASFTDTLDYGWLVCEHQSLLRADYPKLFSYFQTHKIGSDTMLDIFGSADSDHFYLPDTREVTLVGAGQNDSDSIAAHDVYTVGQFKDDQVQEHTHVVDNPVVQAFGSNYNIANGSSYGFGLVNEPQCKYQSERKGTTTHSKQKGVKFIIKVL